MNERRDANIRIRALSFLSIGLLLMGHGPLAQAEEGQGNSATTLNDCIEIHEGIPPGVSVDPWKCEPSDLLPLPNEQRAYYHPKR